MGGKSYKLYKTLKSRIWVAVTIIKANQEGSKIKEKKKILSDLKSEKGLFNIGITF
jgi:hypothetical protein